MLEVVLGDGKGRWSEVALIGAADLLVEVP